MDVNQTSAFPSQCECQLVDYTSPRRLSITCGRRAGQTLSKGIIGSVGVSEIGQITVAGISRYFQLVVALEAVVVGPNNSKVEVPLFCLATERIIVRVRRTTFWAKIQYCLLTKSLFLIPRLPTRVSLNPSRRRRGASRVEVTRFVRLSLSLLKSFEIHLMG